MILPNFLFIGPDKSGSTWLQATLSPHPEVFLPAAKDTYYFGASYSRGLDWYAAHFAKAPPQSLIVGEICHDYLFDIEAADRILDQLPRAKLMVCLREPVDRAFSAYLNMRRNGWQIGSFHEAIERHPEILDHSRYGKHLATYFERFPADQILVTWFDELVADPQAYFDTVTDALGIARHHLTEQQRRPARAAAEARSPVSARAVKRAAGVARDLGMAGLIGRVKSSDRVQRTLYRPISDSSPRLTDIEIKHVRNLLRSDVLKLETLLDVHLSARWGW